MEANNIIDFNIEECRKQIEINVNIEEIIIKYKDMQYKNERYIKCCNINKKNYVKKLNKFENFKTEDKAQFIRMEIFKETCKKSIELYNLKIKEAEEKAEYELSVLKQQIISILNDAFVNGLLNENTLILQSDFTIYNVPSAKLRFKRVSPVLYDKKDLKFYLLECNLEDDYILEGDINWEKLKCDLEICEDNSIYLKEYGLLMNHHGIKLSDPELHIKFL